MGHTLHDTNADPVKYATYKYFIDIEPHKNYKQYLHRTYNDICLNCDKIQSLIKKETNPHKLDLLLIHKYKIRPSPPYDDFVDNIRHRRSDAERDGYSIMDFDSIYQDIIKKIQR